MSQVLQELIQALFFSLEEFPSNFLMQNEVLQTPPAPVAGTDTYLLRERREKTPPVVRILGAMSSALCQYFKRPVPYPSGLC